MKNIFNYVLLLCPALVLGMLSGCSADTYDGVDPNARPNAEDIDVTITVDQETNTYTLTLNNVGYYPMWTVNVGRNPRVSSQNNISGVIADAGTYQVEVRMGNRNGLCEGSKVYDIVIENSLAGDVFTGFKYDTDFNLWKNCTFTSTAVWFADDSWNSDAVAQPEIEYANDGFSFLLPAGMGSSQWQGQVHINTDISTSSANHYDFSILLSSTENHPGVTVKLQDKNDDGVFYCESKVVLEANTPKCFYLSDLEGLDINEIQLTLDFGGGVTGSEVSVSNVVLKDHANDDGTVLPPSVEFDDERNLFNGFSAVKLTTWFANNDWNSDAVTQPVVDVTSDGFSFVMPAGVGSSQWQGQVHLWTDVKTSSDKRYDFRIVFLSTEDHPQATIKLQRGDSLGEDTDTDDNSYYCLEAVALKANIPTTYYFEDIAGIDINNIQVCCDFGGGTAGSTITVSKLHLQEHK